jgi:hypothetical protein
MHGRTVSYGTQKTALLAFLALDTLHHYLQTLLREHSISDLSATYQTAVQDAKAAKKLIRARKGAMTGWIIAPFIR